MADAAATAAKAKADAAAKAKRRKKRPHGFMAPYNCYQKFTWVYHTTLTAVRESCVVVCSAFGTHTPACLVPLAPIFSVQCA